MKLRRIFAAIAACAVAATMAISASAAEPLMTSTGNPADTPKYVIDFKDMTEDQIKSVVKIEANISVTSDYVKGTIGYNSVSAGKWTSPTLEIKGEAAPASGNFTLELDAGDLAALGDDGSVAPYAEVQFWWVNPLYDAEGNEAGDGTATLNCITFYDASGAVVASIGEIPATETPKDPGKEESKDESKDESKNESKNESKDEGNKNDADDSNKPTGATAGLALAGLAIAGAAVVAAKKSK